MVRAVTTDITKHKQAEERLRILAEAGRTLDTSLDYETTLSQRHRQSSCPRSPTIASSFSNLIDGKLEMVTSAHSDPARAEIAREFFRHYPLIERPDQPLQTVHRTGQSVLMQDAMIRHRRGRSRSAANNMRRRSAARVNAGMAVPLRSRGQILGVMVWV